MTQKNRYQNTIEVFLNVPIDWSVETLGNISDKLTDGSHSPPPKETSGLPMLSGRNIKSGRIVFDEFRLISEDSWVAEDKRTRIEAGDVLLSIVGTIGESAVFSSELRRFTVQRSVAVLSAKEHVRPKFLSYWLRSPVAQEYFASNAKGTAQKGVYLGVLSKLPIPIPSFSVQERIVEKIELLFNEVDDAERCLNKAKSELNLYKQSVLNSAVQGKLVPQDSDDEPASELLERIRVEKEKLIKEGKLKKENPLPPINPSEVPFKLPDGWEICRLCDLKIFSLYGPRFSSEDYAEEGTPVLRTSDIDENGLVNLATAPKIKLSRAEIQKYRLKINDILITRTGSLGTLSLFSDRIEAIPGAYLIQYRIAQADLLSSWILKVLESPYGQQCLVGGGRGVGRPNINVPTIDSIVVPIPPLQQIEKILEKVREQLEQRYKLIQECSKEEERLKLLRASILKSAFEGKLI